MMIRDVLAVRRPCIETIVLALGRVLDRLRDMIVRGAAEVLRDMMIVTVIILRVMMIATIGIVVRAVQKDIGDEARIATLTMIENEAVVDVATDRRRFDTIGYD
jgi:hypothetical protein